MPDFIPVQPDFGLNENLANAIYFEFSRLGAEAVVSHSGLLERNADEITVLRGGEQAAIMNGPMHLVLSASVRASSLRGLRSTWRDIPVEPDAAYEKSVRASGTVMKRHLRSVARSLGLSSRIAPGNPHVALALAAAEAILASQASHLRDSIIVPEATRVGLVEFGRSANRFVTIVERSLDYLPAAGPNGHLAVREALSEVRRRISINQIEIDALAFAGRPDVLTMQFGRP